MGKREEEIERIVNTYSTLLLRLVMHDTSNRSDCEDIVQETFLRYLQKAPEFKNQEHEKAWLIRVCSNLAKDYHKSWWKKKTIHLNEDVNIAENKKTDSNQLLPYIRKLPIQTRHAIYLFYYEQYSIARIAEIYQVKENTVSSWLHRGRKKLKELLKGEDEYDLG